MIHKKKITILGSTGSIGVNTLDVVARHPEKFSIFALVAGKNVERFAEQILKSQPEVAVLKNKEDIPALQKLLKSLQPPAGACRPPAGGHTFLAGRSPWKGEILSGEEGACRVASDPEVDIVLSSIVGCAGLSPTHAALCSGKTVALANKESLVAAGPVMMNALQKHGGTLIPVDSEHSAIFQVLEGQKKERLRKIVLTASGGPFRKHTAEQLKKVTVAEALKHPNWSMGSKITIDSATLMNKGLEMIEAKWLFALQSSQIEVRIHPQSIVHSLVEFKDGSWLAQMGLPDMRVPIAYALAYPDRVESGVPPMELTNLSPLTFETPDETRFPSLRLARAALEGE